MKKSVEINTERLVLRPFGTVDRGALCELLKNEMIQETYMVPELDTEEETEKLFQYLLSLARSKDHYYYGIYRNREMIGFLNDTEIEGDRIELGYVVHPAYHNQGYCTEALGAVIEVLFQAGFRKIQAGFFEGNAASRRVLEKCDMVQTVRKDTIEYRGKRHQCLYYEIIR